jgi:hypothetical protein
MAAFGRQGGSAITRILLLQGGDDRRHWLFQEPKRGYVRPLPSAVQTRPHRANWKVFSIRCVCGTTSGDATIFQVRFVCEARNLMERYRKPSHVRGAIHIVPGEVRIPGARKTIQLRDQLTWGPCSGDPDMHRTLRLKFLHTVMRVLEVEEGGTISSQESAWDNISTPSELREALDTYASRYPVVIWTSSHCGDRVLYWWTLYALQSTGLSPDRFWIAESILMSSIDVSLSIQPANCLEAAFASTEQLVKGRLRFGASLWRKFTSPSPRGLDQVRSRSDATAHDLRAIETLYYWGIPRASNDTGYGVSLSELDRSLLGCLTTERWVRPLEIILASQNDPSLRVILNTYGDNGLALRLNDWATAERQAPLIRSRALHGGKNLINGVAYQLTDRGSDSLQKGIEDPALAPKFHIGGFAAYSKRSLWVRRLCTDRRKWILERIK